MNVSLLDFLRDYYIPLKGISDRTAGLYELTIRPFSRFLGRPAMLSDLTELTVARFLTDRSKSVAPATTAKDRSQLRAIWEMAARRGMVSTWPTIKRIVVPERIPEAWLTDDMRRIFDAIAAERGAISSIPASMWWRAIVMLNYETGERCGALLALKWQDVGPEGVVFRAETRKGSRRDIYREITPECLAALNAIRGSRDTSDLVLPWDMAYTYIWSKLADILKRAGLPHDRRSKFHRLRRTTASYYEAAGGSAQRLLDHSSPAVTRRYLDPRVVKTIPACGVIPKVG